MEQNQIWANFGPVGNIEKKIKMATFEGAFSCFQGQKNDSIFFQKYCSARTKMLHQMNVRNTPNFFLRFSHKF